MLRASQDPTAPATAVELVVKKHAFTLSFTTEAERDAFVRVWVNGVPPSAVPQPLSEKYYDATLSSVLHAASTEEQTITPGRRASLSEQAVPQLAEGAAQVL